MQVVAIIPARFGSTRFPGKPLACQTGKPLIQHVYERVVAARSVQRCIVATDDQRIAEAVRGFGGDVEMTRADHPSGTDRLAEVVARMAGGGDDLILNVQGDEPEMEPDSLDRLVARMAAEPDCRVGTLACPLPPGCDPTDPGCVKVVCDRRGRALYFSRAPIPFARDAGGPEATRLLHLGVYAYRRDLLLAFASWPPGRLEQIEKLEQLRLLERGEPIVVEVVDHASPGIDTPEEYQAFVARQRAG